MSWWGSKKEEEPKPSSFDSGASLGGGLGDYETSSSSSYDMPSSDYTAASGGHISDAALQEALAAEQQRVEVQQAVTKIADIAFKKCVGRPGEKLSSSEQSCIANCAERYLDSSMYITQRLMKQQQQHQH